jgi:hypothetical protein
LAALVGLAGLAGIGFGIFEWMQPVRVQDASQRISIEVPRSWSKELMPEGWDPGVMKLSGDPGTPGLVVADHAQQWNDLEQDTNGVFVGLSADADLKDVVATMDHPGCRYRSDGEYHGAGELWSGLIRSWDTCVGGSRSIQEISLISKGDHPQRVYVQIRQDGTDDVTVQILDSLRVTDSAAAQK